MNVNKTRKLIQGSMIAALFGVLSLLNTYTGGMFDIFICYAMVSFIAWYGLKYSIKENLIVVLVSMIVVMMVGTPFFVISSFASALSGVVIGECLKKKASKSTMMLGVFIVCLINNYMIYEIFSGLLGINLISEMELLYEQLSTIVPYISLETMIQFIPLVLIIMSAMEMYIIILLTQLILRRLHVDFPAQFHIATMHLSKKTGIILLSLLILSYSLYYLFNITYTLILYIMMLCILTIMLQGFGFISFIVIMQKQKGLSILLMISLFMPMFYFIYFVFGVLDIFSDLRKNILYNSFNNKE